MSDPEQSWQKLVDAARKTPPPPAPSRPASPGFANRIVAMRDSIAAFVRTMAWQRWSVLVAVICGAVFLAVLAVTRCSEPPRPLIDPPSRPLLDPPAPAQPNP
jgi:hypothetical protein